MEVPTRHFSFFLTTLFRARNDNSAFDNNIISIVFPLHIQSGAWVYIVKYTDAHLLFNSIINVISFPSFYIILKDRLQQVFVSSFSVQSEALQEK